jgi:hypothetical protein
MEQALSMRAIFFITLIFIALGIADSVVVLSDVDVCFVL